MQLERAEAERDAAVRRAETFEVQLSQDTDVIADLRDELTAAMDTIKAMTVVRDGDVFYVTRNGVAQDIPERIARRVRAVLGLKEL